MTIRNEQEKDFRQVENLTREAFWNLYVPGCNEHYFAHTLRQNPAFIPELDFVLEENGRIVANIMYSRSKIVNDAGEPVQTITFGPLSVLPERQREGYGGALVRHSVAQAKRLGYKAILIYGDPAFYSRFGFKSAKSFRISTPEGKFLAAHQALELQPGTLDGMRGRAFECDAFKIDAQAAKAFDEAFPPKERKVTESQKRFAVLSALEAGD